MPTYTFRNKESGEEFTEIMSNAARETFLAENPHVEQLIVSGLGTVDSIRLGRQKPDGGFRDLLREMKKKHPLSKGINTF
jgi:hypothetical protein